MIKPTQLVWLRNDLRLDDNPALALAQQQGNIHVVFCATPAQWQAHNESPARLGLKANAIQYLSDQLAELGIPFTLLTADMFSDLPALLGEFCQQYQIQQVWFNRETPLDERRRDQSVSEHLMANSIEVKQCDYDLLVAMPVLNKQGLPFKVFTPFYKCWLQLLEQGQQTPYSKPTSQGEALATNQLAINWAGEFREDLWPVDENNILNRLDEFCDAKLQYYEQARDFPSRNATSTLSPYLANGQLGPRRCLSAIQFACIQHQQGWQDNAWLRELAWRDFYRQLLVHFPRLSYGKPFIANTEKIIWVKDEALFQAWCQGKTGFPIIDAAMRQLLQTGWMHNRLRMLTASFLTKLLFIDWRKGEQFFMQHLIDGEFAANNGGWQWSASTGCDAAPYFRVFNPSAQSQKFDAEGVFIKRFVPELADVDKKQIHDPPPALRDQLNYPQPVINYKTARLHAIETFRQLRD